MTKVEQVVSSVWVTERMLCQPKTCFLLRADERTSALTRPTNGGRRTRTSGSGGRFPVITNAPLLTGVTMATVDENTDQLDNPDGV